jgi:acetoacetate decarboxylase
VTGGKDRHGQATSHEERQFFIPRQQVHPFFNPGSMDNEEGLYVCWETDPATARRVLPPQLHLLFPEHPVVMVYVVNIRERIAVERTDDCARVCIVSKGRRIFDVDVELGAYNDPRMQQLHADAGPGRQGRGSCLLFQYEHARAADGHVSFPKMQLLNYDSVTDDQTWEPPTASTRTGCRASRAWRSSRATRRTI